MAWLSLLGLLNVVLFGIVTWLSVRTVRGQLIDTVALYGNGLGRRTVDAPLDAALGAISTASLVVVLLVIAVVAVVRRRIALAVMSATVVVGAAGTTWLLKRIIDRPWLGIDPDRIYAGNSLPSGHATAAAAFAIALTLVLPPRVRGAVSLLGATYAATVGVATLSSGWHRPSDVVAAYLVTGAWAAFAGLVLVRIQKPTAVVTRRERAEWSLGAAVALGSFLAVIGLALLLRVVGQLPPIETGQVDPEHQISTSLRRLAYLGSALTVAGAAYLMMAVVLVSVHRVVPHSPVGVPGTGPAPQPEQKASDPAS